MVYNGLQAPNDPTLPSTDRCAMKIKHWMTSNPLTVKPNTPLMDAAKLMRENQIRRLPVVDKDGRLVGVVSLGDLSTRVKERYAGEALEEISRP